MFIVEKLPVAEVPNTVSAFAQKLIASASHDFKLALLHGCQMDVTHTEKDGIVTVQIKTHNLISILKDPKTDRAISIIEKHR